MIRIEISMQVKTFMLRLFLLAKQMVHEIWIDHMLHSIPAFLPISSHSPFLSHLDSFPYVLGSKHDLNTVMLIENWGLPVKIRNFFMIFLFSQPPITPNSYGGKMLDNQSINFYHNDWIPKFIWEFVIYLFYLR